MGTHVSEISYSYDSFVAIFRQDIVNARIKLASPSLPIEQQRELWQIVECREWFIKMLSPTYEAELEQIDRDLEAALRR
jgi:hypothetical protein